MLLMLSKDDYIFRLLFARTTGDWLGLNLIIYSSRNQDESNKSQVMIIQFQTKFQMHSIEPNILSQIGFLNRLEYIHGNHVSK